MAARCDDWLCVRFETNGTLGFCSFVVVLALALAARAGTGVLVHVDGCASSSHG